MTALKPVTKAEWVAALRSGEYEQASGRLHVRGAYCCLGVLCKLAGVPDEAMTKDAKIPSDAGAYEVLPPLGMFERARNPWLTVDCATFASMNDGGKSFAEIADEIERLLPDHVPADDDKPGAPS